MKKIFSILFILKLISANPTPIVLWHGMGDTCCYDFSLGSFKQFLERHISGVYILSLRIGNSTIDDFENGYFMHPNKQVEYVCKLLAKDPRLAKGFNAIGFSQGAQFLRGVVQRCGHKLPPIKNLISLGGQHQGVYGLPHCGALEHTTCDYVRKMLNYAAYYRYAGFLYCCAIGISTLNCNQKLISSGKVFVFRFSRIYCTISGRPAAELPRFVYFEVIDRVSHVKTAVIRKP